MGGEGRAVTRDQPRGCVRRMEGGEVVCPSLESLFVRGFESAGVELILNSRMDMEREGHFLLLH